MAKPSTDTPSSPTSFSSSEDNTFHITIGSSSRQKSPPSKKTRGRPFGSKNKPKIPLMINEDNGHALKPIFIQVPKNSDVIGAVVEFSRRHQTSIVVQSAFGSILNVTLRQTHSQTSAFIVHGPFILVSLTGTYINNNPFVASSSLSSSPNLDLHCSFSISFSSISGQSFTGIVGGKVIAADDVTVAATVCKNF